MSARQGIGQARHDAPAQGPGPRSGLLDGARVAARRRGSAGRSRPTAAACRAGSDPAVGGDPRAGNGAGRRARRRRRARSRGRPRRLLRRHVAGRAEDGPCGGLPRRTAMAAEAYGPSESDLRHPQSSTSTSPNGRPSRSRASGRGARRRERGRTPPSRRCARRCAGARSTPAIRPAQLVEPPAAHELHDVEGAAVGEDADVVHRHDARVLEAGEDARLALEPAGELAGAAPARRTFRATSRSSSRSCAR